MNGDPPAIVQHDRIGLNLVIFLGFLAVCGPPLCNLFGSAAATAGENPAADLAIINGRIWTGVEPEKADPGHPSKATALAVVSQAIVAVGDDSAVRSWIGPSTKVIDARGRRVIPGITDSHTHLISGGFQLGRLALRDVPGKEEFVRAVEAAARSKKSGQWILGGRWSVESWERPQSPSKSWLDPVTRDIPVFLTRMDGHQALVNSAALRLAGIDANGPRDPVGGEIVRDPGTNEPTGILKESAMDLVRETIPEPTTAERYEAFRRAMKHANSWGVTSAHDMSVPEDLEVFRLAYDDGAMTLRVTTYLSVDDWSAFVQKVSSYRFNNKMFRLAGFKGFMDGSLGSRTAFMREPFSDATPQTKYSRGQLTDMADDSPEFQEAVATVDARGLQIAVHAIGDEANHLLLDAYEAAAKRNGFRDARNRVEHAQHLLVSDISRFGKLGVVASMQPFHKADDGRYAEKAIGSARLSGSYAYRKLLAGGALLCFGSDWPVVTLNPFMGMASAVNSRTLAGEVWLPSHALSVEEALRAYTLSPAKAVHQERQLGTLEVGKLADIVVLADDPLTLPADRLGEVRVATTIVAGKIVYERSR